MVPGILLIRVCGRSRVGGADDGDRWLACGPVRPRAGAGRRRGSPRRGPAGGAAPATGLDLSRSAGIGANLSALFHVMGIVAASVGGWLSDRWGRTAVIIAMMAPSTVCSFPFGWLLTAPLGLLLLVGIVYGFSAFGDLPGSS